MSLLTLVIGNKNYSSWSLRPWIFMRHMDIPFEEKRVSLFVDTTRGELAPYDSNYKVPVLQDGDRIVWDTMAIMEYLNDQFLDGRGWPSDTGVRAVARSVSAEMHSSFTALRGACPMNCRKHFPGFPIGEEARRDVARIEHLWARCRKEFGHGGDWLFGDYSIADAMYAPIVMRLHGYDVSVDASTKKYMDTVLASAHLQEWIEAGRQETEVIAEDEVAV